jgi:hypothetical protein
VLKLMSAVGLSGRCARNRELCEADCNGEEIRLDIESINLGFLEISARIHYPSTLKLFR